MRRPDESCWSRTSPSTTRSGTGPDARGPALLIIEELTGHWAVRQIFDDPAGDHDWGLLLGDLAASDEAGEAVLTVTDVGQLGLGHRRHHGKPASTGADGSSG